MMASDSTTPRVLANALLQASGNPTVRLLDAKAARVKINASYFPDLLTTIQPHLRDPPSERNLFNPDKLLAYSACFINLSESFRLSREDDTWLSCFRFVIHSYAFQRHMSPHSHINGRQASLKFFPTLLHINALAIADSPAWIPQAIDSHLLPIVFGSAMFFEDFLQQGPRHEVEELMLRLFKYLTPALIHRSVLKRVLRSLHQLRANCGSLEQLFHGEVHDAWVGFLRQADDMKFFLSYLKTSGLDFADCLNPECNLSKDEDYTPKQCQACRRAFCCSRECQKAHWKDHRENCKKALAERQKGTVQLHADARHEAFVLAHANYMVSREGKFTQLIAAYKRTDVADPRTPTHNIVTVLDYTEAPPKLSVAHAAAFMTMPNWLSTVNEAQAGHGQLAYISIPYIVNEAQHFFFFSGR
ncbi:hypothetical protein CPB85DRAFT_1432380 [Mucidula mucida]|nr:hypothetical protein CPB85DRAFT_1432380 [Mucidula mucida]